MDNVQDLTAQLVNSLVLDITTTLQAQITKQVQADVAQKLAQIDVQTLLRDYVDRTLGTAIASIDFPEGSIPVTAIDLKTLIISGERVKGGIIEHFGSTGIQDSATRCILTILDDATVVENNLVTSSATIKGDLIVDGALSVHGDIDPDSSFFKDLSERAAGLVHMSLNKEMFDIFSDTVFSRIKADGLDMSKLMLNGNEIVAGNNLGLSITESNLQKLGHLKSLTVTGESTLGNALFVGNKRIGIGTTEPAAVLDVWDQEVSVSAGKLRQNVAFFGTTRNQQLVLSANSKENLILDTDGSVSISKLNVGDTQITSSATMPTHDAKPGTWVINSAPDVGKAAAWISLGGARWGQILMTS